MVNNSGILSSQLEKLQFRKFGKFRKNIKMKNYVWPVLLPILFLACSLSLFLRVFAATESVIDEEFHLRQGLHFCNRRFNVWDPKITTFPGLYMFSFLVLNPLNMCNVLGLRLLSLTAAALNVVLLYKIRRSIFGGASSALAALDAFCIASLPPLYFFAHLYYTDTLSLTSVLLFYYFWQKESHLCGAVWAAGSVLMRQTNIVWVGMAVGVTALDELTKNYASMKRIKPNQVKLLNFKTWFEMLTSGDMLLESIWNILRKCIFYLLIILPFVAFVFINGSIVIGDKRAHEATIHLPQLFYFSLFVFVFGVANTVHNMCAAIKLLRNDKLIVAFLLGLCILIAKWNTLVHPYLLADNRHYTFYLWNRFYGHFEWFKYAIVPQYVLALALMYCGMRHLRASFQIMFWLAVVLALCFQRLLEMRYFLIPFVIFRLNTLPLAKSRCWPQLLELFFYFLLNAFTFSVFFKKVIIWSDFKEPQRIIW